jgi:hypothetical protein
MTYKLLGTNDDFDYRQTGTREWHIVSEHETKRKLNDAATTFRTDNDYKWMTAENPEGRRYEEYDNLTGFFDLAASPDWT